MQLYRTSKINTNWKFKLNWPESRLFHYFDHNNFIAGGVLERNEVFNNRFDGICLATGVCPKILGTYDELLMELNLSLN